VPARGTEPWQFFEAFTDQAALALGRAHSAEAAEAAALRARTEEMRNALLSTVSHDLRTPLTVITGAATTLRDARPAMSGGQANDLVVTICEEADRLERLVRDLLDMTRLEAGALEVKREWVSLEEIIGSALTRLGFKLGARAVRTDLATDLPLVFADGVLLEQVFVNLFENATKYTPPETTLEVLGRAQDAAVVIEVADRGPGLPPGSEARIFEKFFRGKHGGTSGAGLGLTICRGIAEAHGGTLVAENRKDGGALFRLRLPVGARPPAVPADVESPEV
jgi:two-component system sensor histidine kinase KdpD